MKLFNLILLPSIFAATPSPPTLDCGTEKIEIVVSKAFLHRHKIPTKNKKELHFANNKECYAIDDGKNFILTIFQPFNTCGTVVEHGEDDYAFTNEVVYQTPTKKLSVFKFRCLYEDKYIVSSKAIKPTRKTLQFQSIQGNFSVNMNMYRTPSYSYLDRHKENPRVKLNDPVYVKIDFEKSFGWSDLTTTIKSCYATDTPNYNKYNKKYSLISGMCASQNDDSVKILENGTGKNAKFKFNMFKWKGLISYIYLHCEVHLCNTTSEVCNGNDRPMCNGGNNLRKKRSKYSINADMSDIYGDRDIAAESETLLYYDDDSDSEFKEIYNPDKEEIPDYELNGFLTKGPVMIITGENPSMGIGTINSTILELSDDERLRIYMISTIAIVIFVVAMLLLLVVYLNRRKQNQQKIKQINEAYENQYGTRDSFDTNNSIKSKALPVLSTKTSIKKDSPIDSPLNTLPAITNLPLPPTPLDYEKLNSTKTYPSIKIQKQNSLTNHYSNLNHQSLVPQNTNSYTNSTSSDSLSSSNDSKSILMKAQSTRYPVRPFIQVNGNKIGKQVERSKTCITTVGNGMHNSVHKNGKKGQIKCISGISQGLNNVGQNGNCYSS